MSGLHLSMQLAHDCLHVRPLLTDNDARSCAAVLSRGLGMERICGSLSPFGEGWSLGKEAWKPKQPPPSCTQERRGSSFRNDALAVRYGLETTNQRHNRKALHEQHVQELGAAQAVLGDRRWFLRAERAEPTSSCSSRRSTGRTSSVSASRISTERDDLGRATVCARVDELPCRLRARNREWHAPCAHDLGSASIKPRLFGV